VRRGNDGAIERLSQVFRLTAIDKLVCADRTLLDKHLRVDEMQKSLQSAAGFPRMLHQPGSAVSVGHVRIIEARFKQVPPAFTNG
jgi:hypothetical protein